jgi:DNA-binding NtrC family response regulator
MARTYRILYVEDEEVWKELLRGHIEQINKLRLNEKFRTRIELVWVESPEAFISTLTTSGPFDLALVDLNLKGDAPTEGKGKALLYQLKEFEGAPPRVVLTARPWVFGAEEALNTGISEYYLKDTLIADNSSHRPSESNQENIRSFLETTFDLPSRYDFNSEEGRSRFGLKAVQAQELQATIVGDELCMWKVKAQIAAAARSNLPVLITGESGTGKELAAYMIHRLSDRGQKNYDWVALNCAAFTPELLMSELFGHVRGAYTDAKTDKRGLLEEAHNSTLFLDEVGHAGYRLQVSLLRALSTGRTRRLGATEEYSFDVRLIAATDQDVFESSNLQRSFINRLAGIRIQMPALRERLGDIDTQKNANEPAKLVSHMAQRIGKKMGKAVKFTPAAIMALAQHSWPGNVRELSHVVEEAVYEAFRRSSTSAEVMVDAAQIRWQLQQSMVRPAVSAVDGDDRFVRYTAEGERYKDVERRFLADYVHHVHEKVAAGERSNSAYDRTARFLGCSPSTVKAKLADFDKSGVA